MELVTRSKKSSRRRQKGVKNEHIEKDGEDSGQNQYEERRNEADLQRQAEFLQPALARIREG